MSLKNAKSTLPAKKTSKQKEHTTDVFAQPEPHTTPRFESCSEPIMSDKIDLLAKAIISVQSSIRFVPMDSDGYGYSYASLASVIESITEPLAKAKLAIVQFPHSENVRVGVYTYLIHESGQYLAHGFTFTLPSIDRANAAQKGGSAITYARRYAICSILGLVADEDTDAT